MKQGNELVRVAVNVIPLLAGPGLQYCYRPLPGQGHVQLASAVCCTSWHSCIDTYRQREKERKKGVKRERELYTHCNIITPPHYIKSVSGSC